MSELNYSLKDLDSLMELGMRNSMFINKKSQLYDSLGNNIKIKLVKMSTTRNAKGVV